MKEINLKRLGVAEVDLVYRSTDKRACKPKISGSEDAYRILLANWDMDKIELVEQFKVLLLNRANHVQAIVNISTGGICATIADPRIIFCTALKANACGLILAHNHPSGNVLPSESDKLLTNKLKVAGQYLEVCVLDHLIIHHNGYYSFADENSI